MAALARVLWVLSLAPGLPHGRQARTAVSLRIPAGSVVTASQVVWRDRTAWFAIAVNTELRIYRWQQVGWKLDGTVQLPRGMGAPQPSTGLRSTSVTGGIAPDFTSHFWGADTLWFALVARLEGRWRVVPFDDQFAPRDPYTFAAGASHHLIEGVFDWCGCAEGPTTYQWYRFAQGEFVPTTPPVTEATCSSQALGTAEHWPPISDDPLVRHVAWPFRNSRFACADGWALATDERNVSVYEQRGRHWVRVGVGPPRLVSRRTELALPRSVLNRLANQIGVRIPPAPPKPKYPPAPQLTQWQRASIAVTFRPGDWYVASYALNRRPNVLTVTIASRSSSRVTRFHWRHSHWVELSNGR